MCYTYVLSSDRDDHEACIDVDDAFRRERFLKTGKGKRFLRNRLATFLSRASTNKLERH